MCIRDRLYTFTNNYGLALILFSLIVKLVLLPMSVKSKKSIDVYKRQPWGTAKRWAGMS